MILGLLSRLFDAKKEAAGEAGVKMKRGTDVVRTPLICPACSRQIAKFTPDRGLAACECGEHWAILDYECKPVPKGFKLDDKT